MSDRAITPGLEEDVEVLRIAPSPRRLPLVGVWRRRRQLRRVLDQARADVLHAHFVRRFGWQAAISGFHPLVVSPWGSDLLKVQRHQLRTRWWNRYALRAADLVTVSSEGMRAAAIRAGARPERIELVHHGVDTSRFSPGPRPGGGRPRILSVRALAPLYRHDTVIDAVALLADTGLRAELVLTRLGSNPSLEASLRERAAGRGIADLVTWIDAVPHEQLPDLYRSGDVLVSIPETDSFPVTLLEAMACGLPAVVSDVPAVGPVYGTLDPLARELVVPVGDAAATARALRRAMELEPDERARLAERSRAHVLRTADYDTNMRRMEAHYRRLAGSR